MGSRKSTGGTGFSRNPSLTPVKFHLSESGEQLTHTPKFLDSIGRNRKGVSSRAD